MLYGYRPPATTSTFPATQPTVPVATAAPVALAYAHPGYPPLAVPPPGYGYPPTAPTPGEFRSMGLSVILC